MSEDNTTQEPSVTQAPQQEAAQAPTPEQALNTLAAAARQARLTYEEHAAVDGCARVLAELVQGQATE